VLFKCRGAMLRASVLLWLMAWPGFVSPSPSVSDGHVTRRCCPARLPLNNFWALHRKKLRVNGKGIESNESLDTWRKESVASSGGAQVTLALSRGGALRAKARPLRLGLHGRSRWATARVALFAFCKSLVDPFYLVDTSGDRWAGQGFIFDGVPDGATPFKSRSAGTRLATLNNISPACGTSG